MGSVLFFCRTYLVLCSRGSGDRGQALRMEFTGMGCRLCSASLFSPGLVASSHGRRRTQRRFAAQASAAESAHPWRLRLPGFMESFKAENMARRQGGRQIRSSRSSWSWPLRQLCSTWSGVVRGGQHLVTPLKSPQHPGNQSLTQKPGHLVVKTEQAKRKCSICPFP